MRTVLVALSLAFVLPPAARGQEEPARFTVGLRGGLAFPAGSSYANESGTTFALSDGFARQIPVQIEGVYRVAPRIGVGAYASYGFDSVGSAVKSTCTLVRASCSANTIRLGLQGIYRLPDLRPGVKPWLGVGAGWEWSSYASGPLTETFSGPEIPGLQGGVDWRVDEKATLGLYLQLSIGRFWKLEQRAPPPQGTTRFDLDARFHAWFGVGVRGTIRL